MKTQATEIQKYKNEQEKLARLLLEKRTVARIQVPPRKAESVQKLSGRQ